MSIAVLPTNNSVPIENVVVADSGDDSEDEWDYIKVDKENPEQDHGTPIVALQKGGEEEKEVEKKEVGEEKGHLIEDIASPTPPPPAATFDETEFINHQSPTLVEAIAQPEEEEAHPEVMLLLICSLTTKTEQTD